MLKVWDGGGRNIKLGQDKFTNVISTNIILKTEILYVLTILLKVDKVSVYYN